MSSSQVKSVRVVLSLVLQAVCQFGLAQQAPDAPAADAPPQTIEVVGVKDPAIMPYAQAYDILSKVNAVVGERVQVQFRITSTKTAAPIPGLTLAIRSTSVDQPLDVAADGTLMIPLNPVAYTEKAEFITNQRKGTLQFDISLRPRLAGDEIAYQTVKEGIALAREAVAQLLPWYLRMVMPSVRRIGVCYPEPGHQVTVRNQLGETHSLHADNQKETDLDKPLHCLLLSANESAMADGDMLLPEPGWRAIYAR